MLKYIKTVEGLLALFIGLISALLGVFTDSFLTLQNFFDLLNAQAINVIFALGLVVVIIAGGIDISFAVGASVVQYIVVSLLIQFGFDSWFWGIFFAIVFGTLLGLINALLIYKFRIVSIIASIGTLSIFFGLLMYFSKGRSIYSLPDFISYPLPIFTIGSGSSASTLFFPVAVVSFIALFAWYLLSFTGFGRTIYGFGSNPEAARRSGVSIWLVQAFAYGWLGLCAGVGGLMQISMVSEVVPSALYGRELDILAAVVLGGAVLGGGKGSVIGAILGVMLLAIIQNGLNLLGISPFAFRMIVGLVILVAITLTNADFKNLKFRSSQRATP